MLLVVFIAQSSNFWGELSHEMSHRIQIRRLPDTRQNVGICSIEQHLLSCIQNRSFILPSTKRRNLELIS
jgi:hypothetical protein